MADSPGGGEVRPDAEISSLQNTNVKRARKLAMKKHRRRAGLVLVEGVRTVGAARDARVAFDTLFCSREFVRSPDNASLLRDARGLGARIVAAPPRILESISVLASPQDVIAAVARPRWSVDDLLRRAGRGSRSMFLWLDGVSDPGNLGTMIRSAHCLGASGFFASPGTTGFFNPRAVRASAGAVFHLPGAPEAELPRIGGALRERGHEFVAASPRGGRPLDHLRRPDRVVLVVGEEASGLSSAAEEVAAVRATIPMAEGAESLNVAAASALLLYHFSPLRRCR